MICHRVAPLFQHGIFILFPHLSTSPGDSLWLHPSSSPCFYDPRPCPCNSCLTFWLPSYWPVSSLLANMINTYLQCSTAKVWVCVSVYYHMSIWLYQFELEMYKLDILEYSESQETWVPSLNPSGCIKPERTHQNILPDGIKHHTRTRQKCLMLNTCDLGRVAICTPNLCPSCLGALPVNHLLLRLLWASPNTARLVLKRRWWVLVEFPFAVSVYYPIPDFILK